MTGKEVSDVFLRALEAVLSWPVLLLVVAVLLRREIRVLLPELAHRLRKVSVAGSTWEFSEVAVKAFKDTLESGVDRLKDKPTELATFVKEQARKLPETVTGSATADTPLTGYSILWVDDHPTGNTYEANILSRLGARVTVATSTTEALSLLNSHKYNLIISDIARDEDGTRKSGAGYDLLDAILTRGQKVPMVFYTGDVVHVDQNRARRAYGAADTPRELTRLVMEALRS